MIALATFRPYIQPGVPQCPVVLVDDAANRAGREYLTQVPLAREDITIVTSPTVLGYASTLSVADHEIARIHQAVFNQAPLPVMTTRRSWARMIASAQSSGPPQAVWYDRRKIWVYPSPAQAHTILIDVSYKPKLTAAAADDALADGDAIQAVAAYARYLLQSMNSAPWSDAVAAAASFAEYIRLMGRARKDDNRGGSDGSLQVEMRAF